MHLFLHICLHKFHSLSHIALHCFYIVLRHVRGSVVRQSLVNWSRRIPLICECRLGSPFSRKPYITCPTGRPTHSAPTWKEQTSPLLKCGLIDKVQSSPPPGLHPDMSRHIGGSSGIRSYIHTDVGISEASAALSASVYPDPRHHWPAKRKFLLRSC